MTKKEPKDGLGFHIKFTIGKKTTYEVQNEGINEFNDTLEEIGLIVEQGKQKSLDRDMEKRVLKKEAKA